MRAALAIPLLALAAAAPAARGQDVAPVISRVEVAGQRVESVVAGGAITIVGARLHDCPSGPPPCDHAELSVRWNGVQCIVLEGKADALIVVVPPELRPGRGKLSVAVDGRGVAECDLLIMSLAEAKRITPPVGGCQLPGPDVPPHVAGLQIAEFEYRVLQDGWSLEAAGHAVRLDGLDVGVVVTFDGSEIAWKRVTVQPGGAWSTTFLATKPWPLGRYELRMRFELAKQARVKVKRVQEAMTQKDREFYDRTERRESILIGTADELEAQRAALRDHVRGALDAADRLLDDVERAYASVSRAAFARAVPLRLGCPGRAGLLVVPGVDAAAHRAHLEAIGLAPTEARLARLLTDDRFGAALGQVDGPALRAWLEGEALPAHAALDARVRAFDERTAVPIDSRVSGALALLVDDLVHTLRRSARAMFRTAGVIPPPSLGEHDAEHDRALDRAGLEARRVELFERVGLPPRR